MDWNNVACSVIVLYLLLVIILGMSYVTTFVYAFYVSDTFLRVITALLILMSPLVIGIIPFLFFGCVALARITMFIGENDDSDGNRP